MASILDLVQHYQHSIEKHPNDEQKILKCIDKLYHLGVTVQHLQETGVGRTVNALRKEPGDVGTAARALVNKWKLMVAAEESSEPEDHNHDTTNYNGHGKDSDDSMNQSRSSGEKSNHQSSRSSQHYDHRHMNGNHSGSKRRYHSSEDSEPDTKKSRDYQSPDKVEYNSKHDVKVKSEQSDSESDDHSDSHSDSESSESSDEDSKVKHKIKTEPTEKHKSSSSKSSSDSHHVDIKKEPKDSPSKKSHEDRHSKHKESRRSPEKTSSSHKSSKEKEISPESKHRSEHKSSDREKSSSSKHSASSERHKSSSNKESSNKKQKSHPEKHESKSDKHRSSIQSHKSDKDELKSPDVKDKHKSKESSSSKDKTSSSDKEKSRDRSSSSKEKSSHSHSKGEKKHSSSSDKSKNKEKSSKSSNGDKELKHRSSSSHKSSKSSSSKIKDDVPKKKKSQENSEDSDDGIDCGSGGLSFAEALGMVSPAKPKKKGLTKDTSSPSNSFDNNIHNDLGPAALLAPTAKLAPLPPLEISALPEISPNYKPRPPPKLLPHFTDDEAMCQSISSKNQRTKVFSGNKTYGKLPSLYELCVNVLQEHIEALEYTGGVPYDILKPVVDKATPQQLFMLEHFNPYLMDDTDHLWQKFCEKNFRNKKRQEMETWREMYIRCQEEQESKLKSLTANIRMTQEAKKAPIKQTKMAYVDTVVKPPRNIARKQALHGTARTAAASPAARVAALASASNVVRAGMVRPPPTAPSSAASSFKPKKAPLMAKALQFMRGKRR